MEQVPPGEVGQGQGEEQEWGGLVEEEWEAQGQVLGLEENVFARSAGQ